MPHLPRHVGPPHHAPGQAAPTTASLLDLLGVGGAPAPSPPPPVGAQAAPPRPVTLTERAAKHVLTVMTKEGRDPASTYLRLGVKGGGCSGLGYLVDFCTQQDEHDHLFTSQGVQVVVDKKSMLYVGGLVVDWESSLKGHGWHFKNPNEKTSCGCGQSFTV